MTEEYEVTVTRIMKRPDAQFTASGVSDATYIHINPTREIGFSAAVPAMPSIEALAALCAAVKPKRGPRKARLTGGQTKP